MLSGSKGGVGVEDRGLEFTKAETQWPKWLPKCDLEMPVADFWSTFKNALTYLALQMFDLKHEQSNTAASEMHYQVEKNWIYDSLKSQP